MRYKSSPVRNLAGVKLTNNEIKNILEIAELLGIEAMFFGAMFAMGWAVVHGQWTLFFAAAAMTYSMEYHIDKKTG